MILTINSNIFDVDYKKYMDLLLTPNVFVRYSGSSITHRFSLSYFNKEQNYMLYTHYVSLHNEHDFNIFLHKLKELYG